MSELSIRHIEKEDLDAYYEIYKNEETLKYIPMPIWTNESKHHIFNKMLDDKAIRYSVLLKDKVIGNINFYPQDVKDTYEVGFVFNKDYVNKGYGSIAIKKAIKDVFRKEKAHRIYAYLDARNIACKRLCEKIGLREEAHFIKDYFMDNEWTDSYIFATLKDEFIK
ncbi:MAG: GNAT family protein [Erysipelotrichaceae bacterium]|nr:GNAT family protein [Erysipelotrichaceae bacterium]